MPKLVKTFLYLQLPVDKSFWVWYKDGVMAFYTSNYPPKPTVCRVLFFTGGDPPNDWSVTNQIDYNGLRQDYFICRFFIVKAQL